MNNKKLPYPKQILPQRVGVCPQCNHVGIVDYVCHNGKMRDIRYVAQRRNRDTAMISKNYCEVLSDEEQEEEEDTHRYGTGK
jgi:transposase